MVNIPSIKESVNTMSRDPLVFNKLFFIAGPCVIESESLCMYCAEQIKKLSEQFDRLFIFKASYDKANRTSYNSFRGLGIQKGLEILSKVKNEFSIPVLTDIHSVEEIPAVSSVVDIIQIPALLCRQTDLIVAAGNTGLYVNIKKGQYMAPWDMKYVVEKVGANALVTERGTCFGYNRLVVDFTGIPIMKSCGVPLIFDATHSIQQPSAYNGVSSGNSPDAIPLASAAICMGVNGLFFEIHPNPEHARCDHATSISVENFKNSIPRFHELSEIMKP